MPDLCAACETNKLRVETAQKELGDKEKAWEKERQALQAKATFPSVKDFVRHCESGDCDGPHQQQWDQYKAKVVQTAWDAMPEKEVERRGLELNLIPRKIIVR